MSKRHGPPPATAVDDEDDDPPGRLRLDKWLWAARFYKTRALAAAAIDGGKVDVGGERAKRARLVQAGDDVAVRDGPYEWRVVVLDVSARRGPAAVAQQLYREHDASRAQREATRTHMSSMPRFAAYGDSKPTKRDRRELRRLKGDG